MPLSSISTSNSELMARALKGCWRASPPPNEIEAELWPRLTPLLIGSGAGALAWRRLRGEMQHELPAGEVSDVAALRESHRTQALHTSLQERLIASVFVRLQQHSLAAILLKGWSSARLYPEAGLRPLGDIDLLVQPSQKELAGQILQVNVDDESQAEG